MSELDQIGIRHNTDKASRHVNSEQAQIAGKDLLRQYERFFQLYRQEPIQILELGVGPTWNCGKSLLTWHDYFSSAEIIGIDIREEVRDVDDLRNATRIQLDVGDLGSPAFLNIVAGRYQPTIIVDDASHLWSHQILSFVVLFEQLPSGGIFVIEDIHTSFGELRSGHGAACLRDAYQFCVEVQSWVVGVGRPHPTLVRNGNPLAQTLGTLVDSVHAVRESMIFIRR